MMNEERRKRGPYIKKENIAFWYPVSVELSRKIEQVRNSFRKIGQRPPGPYQIIEQGVENLPEEPRM